MERNDVRVIVCFHKDTTFIECFTSLKPFYEKYPDFLKVKDSITYYLSRKKIPFETDTIRLLRCEVQKSNGKDENE